MTVRSTAVSVMRLIGINKLLARIYYEYVHGFASAGKELPEVVQRSLQKAIDNGVADDADYCEFGVFKGHTFLHAQLAANRLGLKQMRFFGFDSFEGLPDIEGVDRTENDEFYKGQFACSLSKVRKSLDEHGIDWDRTFLEKGYFSDTLTPETRQRLGIEKIAVALVDGDLYASAKDTMIFLEPLVRDGTILIMDDWNCFGNDDNRGERRAMREFLERNPQWFIEPLFSYGTYGQVFELRKRLSH